MSLADAEWLDLGQVADVLGITKRQVQRWTAEGAFDIEGLPPVDRSRPRKGFRYHRSTVIRMAELHTKKGLRSGA